MVDALIATAQSEKENLLNLGYNQNVELVPNGIDINSVEIKRSWVKKRIILYMGLLRPNKGAGILLDALSFIKDKLRSYKVYIAGRFTSKFPRNPIGCGFEDKVKNEDEKCRFACFVRNGKERRAA